MVVSGQKLQALERRIREDLEYIDRASPMDEESPRRWHDAVELTREYLASPGSQGKNPAGRCHQARSDTPELNFLTMHRRDFTRVAPYPAQYNFVQWQDQAGELHVVERQGGDKFPVYDSRRANRAGGAVAITLGVVSGTYTPDTLLTVYDLQPGGPKSARHLVTMPDLQKRGVTRSGEGSYRFDRSRWQVDLNPDTPQPTVEFREKFRDQQGRLQTPEQPTARMLWDGDHLVWDSPTEAAAEIQRLTLTTPLPEFEQGEEWVQIGDQVVTNNPD